MSASLPLSPTARRLVVLLALAMISLTAADAAITVISLENGGVELNQVVRDGAGGLHLGLLLAVNVFVLVPLAMAYAQALRHAADVPHEVVDHWWRHLFNLFVHPRSAEGKARKPLRLATAAMLIVVLKMLIVTSNVLAIVGLPNPASSAVTLLFDRGISVEASWRLFYAAMIVPCSVVAVGLAALSLRQVQHHLAPLPEARPA